VNLVTKVLKRAGYWVCSAPNGDQALEVVEGESPGLILLDLVMPGKSGLEVCQILKTRPKTKNIPVIMFTALGRDVDRDLSKWAGADAHFTKPFKNAQLLTELDEWLRDSKSSKFSRQLGINHSELLGRKILIEFDPSTDYEKCVSDFAVESTFHEETTVVLTGKATPIRKAIEGHAHIAVKDDLRTKFSSILIEYPERPLNIIFDSITSLVLTGNDDDSPGVNMFRFAENSLQILTQPDITALFLLNPSAHDSRAVSSVRGIFANQLAYGEQGLSVVKLKP
jgi:CheY-like chemotaxis protein